jgi:hypothetical protein
MATPDKQPRKATMADAIAVLVHRVLARHAPYERCPECPKVGT